MLASNDRTAPSPLKMLAFDTMAVPKHYTPQVRDDDDLICFVNVRLEGCGRLQTLWINATARRIIKCPPEHMLNGAHILDAAGRMISAEAAAQNADVLLSDDDALQRFLTPQGSLLCATKDVQAQEAVLAPSGLYTPVSPASPVSPLHN